MVDGQYVEGSENWAAEDREFADKGGKSFEVKPSKYDLFNINNDPSLRLLNAANAAIIGASGPSNDLHTGTLNDSHEVPIFDINVGNKQTSTPKTFDDIGKNLKRDFHEYPTFWYVLPDLTKSSLSFDDNYIPHLDFAHLRIVPAAAGELLEYCVDNLGHGIMQVPGGKTALEMLGTAFDYTLNPAINGLMYGAELGGKVIFGAEAIDNIKRSHEEAPHGTQYLNNFLKDSFGLGAVLKGASLVSNATKLTTATKNVPHITLLTQEAELLSNSVKIEGTAGHKLPTSADIIHIGTKEKVSVNTGPSKIEIDAPNVYDIHNPVNSSVRVGGARKTDFHHDFSNIIDNYASEAHGFDIIRKDGKIIKLYQIEGGLGNKNGIFEWIVDENKVTHRLFIENGQINGLPNQKLRK